MNYQLGDPNKVEKVNPTKAVRALYQFIKGSRLAMSMAFVYLLINSLTTIIAPFIIGDVSNKYIAAGDKDNLIKSVLLLALIYIVGALFGYFQTFVMGKVGQSILFRIRDTIFRKVQSLPLMFFNQNKSGDLISRINNDSEKMNQAFSETLLRFTGDIVVIVGIGIAMLILNTTLGVIAWIALAAMLFITFLLAPWMRSRNDNSLQQLGEMSGEIQESLSNFRVTVVFNRRDYFRSSFKKVNEKNRKAATMAGIANGILTPIYNYAGNIASALILLFGIQILILDKVMVGQMPEFGSLLTFILYSSSFFGPLKELGELFSQFQTAIASWSRIYKLLRLESNLKKIESEEVKSEDCLMAFHNVSFGYDVENMVLNKINMELEAGKTYALVGPTGGGKSTTASLMARLYDISEGQIFYKGKDIRSYDSGDLAKEIGFILQEPFLFTGALSENIKYGNDEISNFSDEQLEKKLIELGLEELIKRFNEGLQTVINPGGENISLGQKQLIAFVRVLLRQPKLLILDEATANIDTITEQILENILNKLSKDTTKVIIAHRLNTIENADQIFFISGGQIEKPLDFKSALSLIETSKGKS
jgi:ATP-binding cassette, subfamily B, bacterial